MPNLVLTPVLLQELTLGRTILTETLLLVTATNSPTNLKILGPDGSQMM